MAYLGYVPTDSRWATELEISGLDAPAETFTIDTTLTPVGQDPKFPSDHVVIPKGRLVGVHQYDITSGSGTTRNTGAEDYATTLTLAGKVQSDNTQIAPLGFAGYNMYMQAHANKAQWQPALFKNRYIRLPYIKALASGDFSNAILGDLTTGDKIAPYAGYSTGTEDYRYIGRVVKWNERRAYVTQAATPELVPTLSSATYKCFTPTLLLALDGSGLPITDAALVDPYWDGTNWAVSGAPGTSAHVLLYEYGQGPEMIAGEILALEHLTSDMRGWLKWVIDNYGAWDLPRIQIPANTTARSVDSSSMTTLTAGSEWRLPYYPLAGYKTISVQVIQNARYVDTDGVWTTGTAAWNELPKSSWNNDQTMGKNYSIDPLTGILRMWGVTEQDSTIIEQATDIRVTYYSEDDAYTSNHGRDFATGQMNLTDGANTYGYAGVPAVYDVAASLGILRVMIR